MRRIWLTALLLVPACFGGDDDVLAVDAPVDSSDDEDGPGPDAPIDAPPASNPGFRTPTAVTKANVVSNGVWTEVGDADWSCLGTPSDDQPSTGTIALGGTVTDFQTGNGVGNAEIFAWSTGTAAIVGTGNSSDVAATRGQFSMTLGMLPAGTTRYGFTITAPSYVSTRIVGTYYPPDAAATDELVVLSEATATALPAFIGVARDVTKGMALGSLRDCQGRAVSNAAVGISSQAGTLADAGGQTFYFSAGSTSLPVRGNVAPVMNKDGRYLVLDVPPAPARVQAWGFRTTTELDGGVMTLLADVAAPIEAASVVNAELEARRN